MNDILILSGWGMPPIITNGNSKNSKNNYLYFDYLQQENLTNVANNLRGKKFSKVIGWSLGGQLACYLITEEIITAKELILISVAYDFNDNNFYKKFINDFAAKPELALQRFRSLVAYGDSNFKAILKEIPAINYKKYKYLSYWLEMLGILTISQMDLTKLPPAITILHGENDVINDISQAEKLSIKLPTAQQIIIQKVGHGLFWRLNEMII
ncbi:MAG: alpha/beta hydrolase [Pseudomonadota bacterium]